MNKEQIHITELGNPADPHGEAGEIMLVRMGETHSSVTDWAFGLLDLDGSECVLDIGCGGGDALKKLSAQITSGTLTGADHSEVSVHLTKKNNFADIESGRMSVVNASVDSLPFPDNSFDLIYTIESFYFWGNDPASLREVKRVLADSGKFVMIADIHGAAELSVETIENIKKYNLFNPTPDELRELLKEAGFSKIDIHLKENTSWICAEAYK